MLSIRKNYNLNVSDIVLCGQLLVCIGHVVINHCMEKERGIIPPGSFNPVWRGARIADTVVLAFIPQYLAILRALTRARKGRPSRLDHSRVYKARDGFMLAGPAISAPIAVLLMESLIAFGAKNIIAVGCAGSINESVKIGDIIVATEAISEEGTSAAYEPEAHPPIADSTVAETLAEAARKYRIKTHEGKVWTTDAPYRESPEKIRNYSAQGALGVEMELSALFTLARYRKMRIGAVLAVSDELFDLTWRPGFLRPDFLWATKRVLDIAISAAKSINYN